MSATWKANPWVWVVTFEVWDAHGAEFLKAGQRERPIIFSAPMVKALLEDRKTQTRRLVEPMPSQKDWLTRAIICLSPLLTMCRLIPEHGAHLGAAMQHPKGGPLGWVRCPWVREGVRRNPAGHPVVKGWERSAAHFIADGRPTLIDNWGWKNKALPAIHMPRNVCRLVLDITDVRVERVQSISLADALAEGVTVSPDAVVPKYRGTSSTEWQADQRDAFRDLWGSIHS